jgi:peptidoglycan/xylan/chitin deacetylase (PgdA/CDA1 family)
MYHRIDDVNPNSAVQGHYVSPSLFRSQIQYLKRAGWNALTMSDLVSLWENNQPVPSKTCVITFDDGYLNFYTNALPVLNEFGFKSTVFLVSRYIGRNNDWDQEINDCVEPLMGKHHIEDALKCGVEFGSHTLTHKHLETSDSALARAEVFDSKAELEQLLGQEMKSFCYPYGGYRLETRNMVEEAGYQSGCSTLKGSNTDQTDRFLLRRLNVRRDTSVMILLYKLMRGHFLDR